MTLQELADVVGVSKTNVHEVECGKYMPRLQRLPAYAEALRTDVATLMRGVRGSR